MLHTITGQIKGLFRWGPRPWATLPPLAAPLNATTLQQYTKIQQFYKFWHISLRAKHTFCEETKQQQHQRHNHERFSRLNKHHIKNTKICKMSNHFQCCKYNMEMFYNECKKPLYSTTYLRRTPFSSAGFSHDTFRWWEPFSVTFKFLTTLGAIWNTHEHILTHS